MSIERHTSEPMDEYKKHRHLYLTVWVSSCVVGDVKEGLIVLIEKNMERDHELS